MVRHFAPRALVVLLILSFALAGVPAAAAAPLAAPDAPMAAVSLSGAYSQNFNTLATSGTPTWTDDSTIPGWYSTRTTYQPGTGSSNTGSLYSFGTGTSNERALGSVASSGTGTIRYGVRFTNGTGSAVTSITVAYTGEQWRNGGNTTQHKLSFDYQIGATVTSLTAGTWTAVTALDFTGPIATSTAAALDGNATANRVALSASFAVSIPAGQEIMLRWSDPDDTGNDHGLAVDDLTVDIPPTISSTSPVNNATGVAVNAPVSMTFSENVTFNSTVQINCTSSGIQNVTPTGGSLTWTLPHSNFQSGETCTITVDASDVSDADTVDPPDYMAAAYIWNFTVVGAGDAAPSVTGTDPTNTATGVALNKDVSITFSEAVNVASGWYTISCGTSGNHTAIVTGGPTDFTLNPDADFVYNELCTVTVLAAKVTDQDAIDPPDNMTGDYQFTFTTMADPCPNTGLTLISAIQGSGTSAVLTGIRTVQGIVIGDYETTGRKGYFVQEEDADADGNPATSEGIFVYDANTTSEVSLGDKVRVTGTVTEFNSLTELGTITSQIVCTGGQGGLVTTTPVSLPAADSTALERYEGMRVSFAQALTVTDNYDLGRYGQLTLSEGGKLWQYTHLNAPNNPGYANYLAGLALRSIILDDGSPTQNLDPIFYPGAGLTAANTVRVGDTVAGLTAVLDQYTAYQLQPIGQVDFTVVNARPTAPPAVGGNVKVGAFNTLNFFVTIGTTACGPTGGQDCRGADNADEFTKQRAKLVAAICGLNADVLGLMELENLRAANDPYPADGVTDYVLQNLVGELNASAACADDYAFIDNTGAGTDAIRQGLIYKPTVVTPVGTTAILNTTAFINGGDSVARNRPALTQAFEVNDGGERFIISVNHLKSKGSACDTADALDGQGNCAVVRTNAANALTAWLATDPTGTGDPDITIMGDLNSYAKENPITALVGAGYTDLINWTVGSAGYSYAFDGMMGYLDHALGSSALLAQALAANEWHINSDEPDILDYDTQFKSASQQISLYNADAYRSTDHDPVLVGLGLYPDRSDLASGYGQAWHTGQGNPWRLGATWTGEASSGTGTDTDDGVVRNYAESWNDGRGEVQVTVTGPAGKWACLNAWLDYSDGAAVAGTVETPNGAFDANEHVVNNLAIQAGAGQLVTWPLEQGVINAAATYNMRFRLVPDPNNDGNCGDVTLIAAAAALAPDGGALPTGRADGGEVEDYAFAPGPLAVTLASFTAATAADGVTLAWETVSEADNAGFNLYRAGDETGPWVKLNAALIPAAAPGSSGGHAYTWTDATAAANTAYVYRLEAVALDGTAEILDTLGVTFRPAQRRWLPLVR